MQTKCHESMPGEGGGYYRCQVPETAVTVPIPFYGHCPTCGMKLEVSEDGQSGSESPPVRAVVSDAVRVTRFGRCWSPSSKVSR